VCIGSLIIGEIMETSVNVAQFALTSSVMGPAHLHQILDLESSRPELCETSFSVTQRVFGVEASASIRHDALE